MPGNSLSTRYISLAVHFELGPVEYGQDLGHLSLQDGWLYFEGERSTFSLGVNDFSCRWIGASEVEKTQTSLDLTLTDPPIAIRIESLSIKDSKLRHDIKDWVRRTRPVAEIAVLPPAGTRKGLSYSLLQRSRLNLCLIAGAVLGFLVDTVIQPQPHLVSRYLL